MRQLFASDSDPDEKTELDLPAMHLAVAAGEVAPPRSTAPYLTAPTSPMTTSTGLPAVSRAPGPTPDDYATLLTRHNELVRSHEQLIHSHKELVRWHRDLTKRHGDLQAIHANRVGQLKGWLSRALAFAARQSMRVVEARHQLARSEAARRDGQRTLAAALGDLCDRDRRAQRQASAATGLDAAFDKAARGITGMPAADLALHLADEVRR